MNINRGLIKNKKIIIINDIFRGGLQAPKGGFHEGPLK